MKENTLKQEVPKSAQSLIQSFLKGEYKEIYLAFNYFKSAITQEPCIQKLLPLTLPTEETEKENKDENTEIADFIFEPTTKEVCEQAIPITLKTFAIFERITLSEHAARMRVMDSATNNANELISKLQVQYKQDSKHYNRAYRNYFWSRLKKTMCL